MLFQFEINLISSLQDIQLPLIKEFFLAWNFADSSAFYALLISFVWFQFGWKWGARLLYIILLSALINSTLKEFFLLPRPFHLIENLGLVKATGYGFPSGAAQGAVLLPGILISQWTSHRKTAWIFGGLFFALLSLSRVYLGVHFIHDILGGWIVGSAILWFFLKGFPWIEKQIEKQPLWKTLIIGELLPLLFLVYTIQDPLIKLGLPVMMGMALGLVLSSYFHLLPQEASFPSYPIRLLQASYTLISGSILYLLGSFFISRPFLFFLLSVWFSAGVFFSYHHFAIFLKKKEHP
ncbi:MAG: phosphatase PAP2 family protein [Chlamydiota bacterium]